MINEPSVFELLRFDYICNGLGGSVGCAVWLETRRSRVQSPQRSATFFRGDWSMNIFHVILSLPLIQEGQLSVSDERMCTILVNRLEDYACPVNVWLGKLTTLDMTPLGWLGRKTSTQTNYICRHSRSNREEQDQTPSESLQTVNSVSTFRRIIR